ncbi:MAG TPA: hypothetical protein VH650_06335 [Gaiellaceae bacterium]|jgi:hypothetical protein
MADRAELLGLTDEALTRRVFDLVGDVEDEDLRDRLFAATEEVFERAWLDAYRRMLIAEIENDEEYDDHTLKLREIDILLGAIEARAGFRPLAQELARD